MAEQLAADWCADIAAALRAGGCRAVVGCPGRRNAPLLIALAEAFVERCHSHWDERGAAFYALGMARAWEAPVAVCTTSGTAVANLLPAVCEAAACRAPLVLLTADRPPAVHGWAAPQTMPQTGIFGAFAEGIALPEPTAERATRQRVQQRIARAVADAARPLHINVPLGEAAAPPAAADAALPAVAALATIRRGEPPPRGPFARGVIVAGPRRAVPVDWAAQLAAATGYPVLADALSGLRHPAVPGLVACPEARCLRPPADPDVIVRLGPPPLARSSFEWLARQDCPQLVIGDDRDDWLACATHRLGEPTPELLTALCERLGRAPPEWRAQWQTAPVRVSGWHPTAVAALAWQATAHDLVWVANSMAVRDLELVATVSTRRILCHRGLSGIDGTLAAFCGASRAHDGRGLCLLGDLAALHDLNSLALAAELRATIVVINDGGGGIFDRFPLAQSRHHRRMVRTEHRWQFAGAAAQFGLAYAACRRPEELLAALAADSAGSRLIECDVRGSPAIAARQAALASALQDGA
ncbi:MAG: 2-succinyl-5-enolpyruvyl-6-hydroxy-3-cyclohexene-1-carboxylic-acid synthase [Planctomycetes bacterium]|nr:2-succinyl-5-enolpyruvyl-6-hydroxy-3-cyclohexene-1-carboxylic-acid synthase [Planctomycetota bacterium]